MNDSAASADTVFCIICNQSVPYSDATAGSLYADGSQAFACNAHIAERVRWTLAWVSFDIDQYAQHESAGNKAL